MKKSYVKRLIALTASAIMIMGIAGGCSADEPEVPAETPAEGQVEEPSTEGLGGTIMWLSNLSSGTQYETINAYSEMILDELGYELQVVYGDMFNDPAGNLNAVKNAMTNDVVGIIASQDGGLKDIMEEYPDLYVAGYNADMRSVFNADGANAEVSSNEKFLGTIVDGYYDGANLGKQFAKQVIEKGYRKVGTMVFPAFAYPNLTEADVAFRASIEEYNATASEDDRIEVVGDTKVLEFSPLEESYFLEEGNGDLDAIIALLAGVDFVYPTMKSAMVNGSASEDMKLLTAGFNNDEAIIADVGGEGVIQLISISPSDNVAFSIIMLDNAISGKQYSDFEKAEAIDSVEYIINSKEAIDNVMTKSMTGTADVSLAQLLLEDIKKVLTRYNESATYEDLKNLMASDQLTVEALLK